MLFRISVVATALALLLSACSHEDDEPDRKPTGEQEPAVQALEIAWQTPADHAFSEIDDGRGDGLWTTSEQVTVVSDTAVTTYDLATGEEQAEIALPGHVCAVSPDVNAAGVGAVVVGRQSDGVHVDRCQTVVAVDTVGAKVRWRARVRETAYLNHVSVGKQAVAVTDAADGARRLRVKDGHRLPTLGSGPSTSNGVTVVAPNADDTALQVFDQDSGRQLKTLPSTRLYDIAAVLPGTDPVLVAVNDADGFAFRDLSRARPRAVGRQIGTSYPRYGRTVTVDGTTVLSTAAARSSTAGIRPPGSSSRWPRSTPPRSWSAPTTTDWSPSPTTATSSRPGPSSGRSTPPTPTTRWCSAPSRAPPVPRSD